MAPVNAGTSPSVRVRLSKKGYVPSTYCAFMGFLGRWGAEAWQRGARMCGHDAYTVQCVVGEE